MPRKRFTLLLAPFIAFIFMVGWVLTAITEPHVKAKASSKAKKAPAERKGTPRLEVGLINEFSEEHAVH